MLTVFIATHNRASLLSGTLQSMSRVSSPRGGWKLVVIDNGSTDDTRQVIERFSLSLPLTYRFEGVIGKNAALNTGLPELEGDLAVFTDDDVSPDANWLSSLRAAADAHPEADMFGGVVVPKWEVPPPAWLHNVPQAPLFSITSTTLLEGLTDPGNLFGPNLAIRSRVFAGKVRFDESIGPRGTSYPMGSETELLLRLGRQGLKAWHVRGAVVEHYIRAAQMKKSWVLRRAVRHGRGQFRLTGRQDENGPSLLDAAILTVPRMARRLVRMLGALITLNESRLLKAQWEFCFNMGWLVEAYHLRAERPATAPNALAPGHNSDKV